MIGFSLFLADTVSVGMEQGIQQTVLMVAIAVIFFYFIIWRPEQKRRKTLDEKRQAMKKGDKVIVAGGIVGEVFKIQPESIIVKLTDGAKMEVLKGAIQELEPSTQSTEKSEE